MDDEIAQNVCSVRKNKRRRKKQHSVKYEYLKLRNKLERLETEIRVRIDSDQELSLDSWTAADIFLYKTPLFRGTDEYNFALQLALPHGITPFNCGIVLRTIGLNHLNQYYFYRDGASPLHLEGYFKINQEEECIENNILKTSDSDES